ncbi:UbiA prenyltransferase family protein [Candidatus Gracilibacteria bacterium]|nr:UbiA prenyltransferase family protein [Candidatus Gracilibacteria bacterium]
MEKSVQDEEHIQKMPNKRSAIIKKLPQKEREKVEGVIDAIEAAGLDEFIEYIRSPWKMLWPNFVAGIARGFGALVGATIVIGIIGWTLAILIDLPLIGQRLEPYVHQVQLEFRKFTETTNYNQKFDNMEKILTEIRDNTKK